MRTEHIGLTQVSVTGLGLGTAQLGDLYDFLDQDAATAIVDAAWDEGVRYFDTAPHYGLGSSEIRLGRALAGRPRSDYAISTKVGRLIVPGPGETLTREWDFTEAGVRRSLEESLVRLGLDRVDVVLIHDPQEHLDIALAEAYPALMTMKAEGLVGAVGVGSGDLEALEAFVEWTDVDVLMVASLYTLLDQRAEQRLLPRCRQKSISILNAGVFNTGILADEWPNNESRYNYAPGAPPDVLARARAIANVAQGYGISLPRAAVAFAASDRVVASVVLGADNPRQVRANVRLFNDAPVPDAFWSELRDLGLLPG